MQVYYACSIVFIGVQTQVDLVILDILDFDIILVVTYLSPYHVVLNCNAKIVTLEMPGMDKLVWEGVYQYVPMKIISFIRAKKMVGKECLAFLPHLQDVSAEVPFIMSVPIVSEFQEVFPTNCQA